MLTVKIIYNWKINKKLLQLFWAGSLNQWVLPMPLSMRIPQPVLPIKHASLKEKWQWLTGNTRSSLQLQFNAVLLFNIVIALILNIIVHVMCIIHYHLNYRKHLVWRSHQFLLHLNPKKDNISLDHFKLVLLIPRFL